MTAFRRGLRNVYRNKVRTFIVVIILSLSMSVFLTMTLVDQGVNEGIEEVQNNVDTSIVVRPAGSFGGFVIGRRPGGGGGGGFTGGSSYIPDTVNSFIQSIPRVQSTFRSLTHQDPEAFSLIVGIDAGSPLRGTDGGLVLVIDGKDLSGYPSNANIAVISTDYAESNSVGLGNMVSLNQTKLEVVGIFASETRFGSRNMFVPVETVQRIYGLEGQLSQITVTVDSPRNVDAVYDELRTVLDSDELDIIHPGRENQEVVESLEKISQNSRIGATVALVVGGTIVFFIMVLVTRERRREIGTLKALGASEADVMKQFFVETMTIAFIGSVIGLVITAIAGRVIADMVVGEEGKEDSSAAPEWLSEGQRQRWTQRQTTQPSRDDSIGTADVLSSISYDLTSSMAGYALLSAMGIGFLGILYPAIQASRMTPVEALRYE